MRCKNMLKKVNDGYLKVLKIFGIFLGISAPLIEVYQVFLRFVLKKPMGGVEELLGFFAVWLYIISAIWCSYNREHIECGILNVYIKRQITMARLQVLKAVISFIVSCYLSYWGWWYFVYSLDRWKLSDVLRIPWIFGNCSFTLGFFLITMYCVIDIVLSIKALKNTDKEALR